MCVCVCVCVCVAIVQAAPLNCTLIQSSLLRNLSDRLKKLRKRRESSSEAVDGEASVSSEESLKARTSLLNNRVHLLEEHNKQLENCIQQLKAVTSQRMVREREIERERERGGERWVRERVGASTDVCWAGIDEMKVHYIVLQCG